MAQTILIATVHAIGVLGLPIKGAERRRPTATREFDPGDYPDPAIRRAIVRSAFNQDAASVATLRAHSCLPGVDANGRISLLLAALVDDGDLALQLRQLAGRILAEDPGTFSITENVGNAHPPPRKSQTLFDRARNLARPL
ncbi:hypothetical protein [Sphingomonas sp. 3P27F8]|uniref:hypothetical protein n=1 Tax=Sphingomonas sp. 3P27F8 TaxID=2502213 RepID=UPI0010FA4FAC|nr:hypothetical protein [Sphingomonas sp. 3P27F8]